MEVRCYICEKKVEIDSIQRHLHSHDEKETAKAHRKVARERIKANKNLDNDPQPVVESSNGDEPVRRMQSREAPGGVGPGEPGQEPLGEG